MDLFLIRNHKYSDRTTDMICLEARYYNLNRILLQAIALWPFQQSRIVRFQSIIIWIILVTATICQITTFVTTKYTFKFALKVFSCVLFFIVFIVQYSTFRFNIEILKELLEQLHHACSKLRDKNEIAIIQHYGLEAKRFTVELLALFFIMESILCASQTTDFLDINLHLNGTRQQLLIAVEYFIDQQKYFYLILFHMNIAIFIGILAYIAMGVMMFTYLQHICGMFKIACYRIQHAMDVNVLKNINLKNELEIYNKIVYGIYIHREAMELSEFLVSRFETMLFILVVLGVMALSLNLFQIVTFEDDIREVSIPIVVIITITLYTFLVNFFGQNVIDHNNEVYDAAYNIRWYMCPLHVQRLILLLLERKAKEFHLTAGGLFTASFECFATLVKATMSYFTFIHSARQ